MKKVFSVCFLGLALCGCQVSESVSEILAPAASLTLGGVGFYAGKDSSSELQAAYTFGAAATGWMAGYFISEGFRKEKAEEFRTGYDLGRSNATKDLFWTMQALHKVSDGADEVQVYQLPVQYSTSDGVVRTPSSVVLPIVK